MLFIFNNLMMINAIFNLLTMDKSSLPSWLPDFIEKYAEDLKVVQSNSFAIYKNNQSSMYQIFVNCFAVALQKKRSGDSSRCEIEGAYRDWKANSDEVVLKELMSKALEVSKQSAKNQPTMRSFFKAKVHKQHSSFLEKNFFICFFFLVLYVFQSIMNFLLLI